jgi:hypothetical protein
VRGADYARKVALEHLLDFDIVRRQKYLQIWLPLQERIELFDDRKDPNPII